MQLVSSKIWTRVAVSISYDDKYYTTGTGAYNKVHSLIYCWWSRILSISLFLFWIYIIPIFRKGKRKNCLSCTYLCQGLIFRFLSFAGEWHPPESAESAPFLLTFVQGYCSTLSRSLVKLTSLSCQCLSRTKLAFLNFRKRKRWRLDYGPIISLFPPPTIPSGCDNRVTCIPFFVRLITGHGVRVPLTFILCSTRCRSWNASNWLSSIYPF